MPGEVLPCGSVGAGLVEAACPGGGWGARGVMAIVFLVTSCPCGNSHDRLIEAPLQQFTIFSQLSLVVSGSVQQGVGSSGLGWH